MCQVTEELKRKVWNKGREVEDFNSDSIRKDACGAWIKYDDFRNRESIYGWEIDHVFPEVVLKEKNVSQEEIDAEENLRPLNWINNDSKGRDYPVYHASLKAEGEKNVRGDYEFEVNIELQKTLNNLFGKYVK